MTREEAVELAAEAAFNVARDIDTAMGGPVVVPRYAETDDATKSLVREAVSEVFTKPPLKLGDEGAIITQIIALVLDVRLPGWRKANQ